MNNVRERYGEQLHYAELPMEALTDADALVIVTEWAEFRHPDLEEMAKRMRERVLFDGRNLYRPAEVQAAGFTYYCVGKVPVRPHV